MRLLLVNPNTNSATTAAMLAIARESAEKQESTGKGVTIEGITAAYGAPLLVTPELVATAALAVEDLIAATPLEGYDGIILAAFADPAMDVLRARFSIPITGIAEAGMAEAAEGGRRFAVVTTTPGLVDSIAGLAARYGHGAAFLGTGLTEGDPASFTADATRLPIALLEACRATIRERGAEAIVIGGGPLAVAARAIAEHIDVPLIEPVPAAVRLAIRRAKSFAGETEQ